MACKPTQYLSLFLAAVYCLHLLQPDMPTDVNPLPSSDGLFAYPSEAKAVATDSYSYAINDEDGLPLFPGDSILQMSESAAEGMASCFEANQSLAALIAAEKLYKGSKAGSIKALRDKFDKVSRVATASVVLLYATGKQRSTASQSGMLRRRAQPWRFCRQQHAGCSNKQPAHHSLKD
jgi:hypothetical protein